MATSFVPTLPAAKNWSTNPSFETNVTGFEVSGTGSTGPTQHTEGYAGTKSARVVFSGTAAAQHARIVLANRPVTVLDDDIAGAVAVKGTVGQQVSIHWRGYSSGGTSLIDGPIIIVTLTAAWQYIVIPTFTITNATAVRVSLVVQKTTQNSVSTTVDIDAIDIRINAPFDHYVDGDQGTSYTWGGTANASVSNRAVAEPLMLTGRGGLITVSSEIVKSNALGADFEDLTEYVIDGSITTDIDRDIKATLSLNVSDPAPFVAYEWVKVYQTITRETGVSTVREPVGLFQLTTPTAQWPLGDGKVSGFDPTILLAGMTTTDTYNIAGGVAYTTAITTLLTAAGFGGRYNIPADARVLPTGGKSFPVGTSYLTMINWALDAIGYYTLFMLSDGRLGSIPYLDRTKAAAHHSYTVGQDAEIVDSVDESMSTDNLFNYVRVVKTTSDEVESTAFAENDNPSHPFSTVTLGAKSGLAKVYVLKKIEKNEAADAAALQAIANENLARASMTRYLTITALPDAHHMPHEITDLLFDDVESMAHMSGPYYTEYHSFGLAGSAGTAIMKLRRIESYD